MTGTQYSGKGEQAGVGKGVCACTPPPMPLTSRATLRVIRMVTQRYEVPAGQDGSSGSPQVKG